MPSLFPPPGPDLPSFSTLYVKGNYHPSAPFHLAIQHVLELPRNEVLVIAKSQQSIQHRLARGLDSWITHTGATNKMNDIMAKILILYPPSPAHLALLLAVLAGLHSSSDLLRIWSNLPTFPTERLSLIIPVDLSEYFTTNDIDWVPAYSSLIARILYMASNISQRLNTTFSVACFETFAPSQTNHIHFIENLFQWIYHFKIVKDEEQYIPSSQVEENTLMDVQCTSKILHLHYNGNSDSDIVRERHIEYKEVTQRGVNGRLTWSFA